MSEEEALLVALADNVERADFATVAAYRAAYRITWTELTGLAMADVPQEIESASRQFPPPTSPAPTSPAEIQKASYQLASPAEPQSSIGPRVHLQDDPPPPDWIARVPAGYPVDQTMPAPGLMVIAKDPLPFITQAPATPETLFTSITAELPVDMTLAAGLVIKNLLPFQPVPSPQAEPRQETTPELSNSPAPRLTLEQYASLCVEIAVFPQQVEAIFQRYGLVSQSQRLTMDLAWKERLRRDSTEYGKWHRLYQRYQAYWTDPARSDGPL